MVVSPEWEMFLLDYLKHIQDIPGVGHWSHHGKVSEELGEASEALCLMQGLNPRKADQDASPWDVAMEYADVIMTAAIAIIALGYGPDQLMEAQWKKAQERVWW